MTQAVPTITFRSAASQMSTGLARLSACLLRAQYAFLQTCRSAEQTDIEVFDPSHQLLVVCTWRGVATQTAIAALVAPALEDLAADRLALIQALVQAGTAPAETPA